LAAALRADVDAMARQTERVLLREQPELVARVDPAVRREAIAFTHARFVEILDGGEDDDGRARHVAFGAAMAAAGLTVEELLAGYRVGGQVGWRFATRHARALGLDADAALALAGAAMAYTDTLARDAVDGFARAARAAARDRQALLEALIAGDADAARRLGAASGRAVPERVAVGILVGAAAAARGMGAPGGAGASGVARLDERVVLVGALDGATVVVGEEAALRALDDVALAVGPAVPVARAPESLARARRVAALVEAGVLRGAGPVFWEEHLPELVVHADAAAADALAARALAPLDGLAAARARMLRETLAAWLDHPGRPREIARVLHLHHQTVRYRLARLRERFGDEALDDPAARFELALALARRRAPV
jgi:hypothetical protein